MILVLREFEPGTYEGALRGIVPEEIFTLVIRQMEVGGHSMKTRSKDRSSAKSITVEDPMEYTFKGRERRSRINTEEITHN